MAIGQTWMSGAAIALVVLLGIEFMAPTSKELLGRVSRVLPMGSAAYIHEHHLPGPMFNDFNWGGFLIYVVPDMPVSMDGRTNVHNAVEIERSWNTWNMGPGWESDPNLARARVIVADPSRALTKELARNPNFSVVFNDGVSVLLVRQK